MNFRLCLIFLLELFMFIEQQHAQDSGEYFLSYNSEELPSPILKKAINNLVGIRMVSVHREINFCCCKGVCCKGGIFTLPCCNGRIFTLPCCNGRIFSIVIKSI
ncbi:uncharacterized protein [Magallana gigas]|uniref:uncharacterized protein n=1 Tax=Magallana gigas TaxID=29159 RepID=UPI003341E0BE